MKFLRFLLPLLLLTTQSPAQTIFGGGGGSVSFPLTGACGTLTVDTKCLDLTATWNNVAVTFTGVKLNVTDTASAAASLLMDLQVGASSKFSVTKNGAWTSALGASLNGSGSLLVNSGGSNTSYVSGTGVFLPLNAKLSFTANADGATSADVFLVRDAANTLALRNGTAGQEYMIYGTFTDTSNFTRLRMSMNVFAGQEAWIVTSGAGTGTAGGMVLGTGNTGRWKIGSLAEGGHLLAYVDNTYDIGASGANRPRNIYTGGTITAGSDIFSGSGLRAAAGGFIYWNTRASFDSPSDGVIRMTNGANTDFTRLQFGGTTSSFPALKRFGTALAHRLADDTVGAFSTLTACASGGEGAIAVVTDSTTTTWGATVTGGSTNHILAYCNGTNWTGAAK